MLASFASRDRELRNAQRGHPSRFSSRVNRSKQEQGSVRSARSYLSTTTRCGSNRQSPIRCQPHIEGARSLKEPRGRARLTTDRKGADHRFVGYIMTTIAALAG